MAAVTYFGHPRVRKGAASSARTRATSPRASSLPITETSRDKMAAETYWPPRSKKQATGPSMRMRLSGRLWRAPNLMIQNGRRDVYGADDSRETGGALSFPERDLAIFPSRSSRGTQLTRSRMSGGALVLCVARGSAMAAALVATRQLWRAALLGPRPVSRAARRGDTAGGPAGARPGSTRGGGS